MIIKNTMVKPFSSPFHKALIAQLQQFWLLAQRFNHNDTLTINSALGQEVLAAEHRILNQLGLPSGSPKFTDPLRCLGYEDHFYPEMVQQCVLRLTRLAEEYLLSPVKTPKQLLQTALLERTPSIDVFLELDMPHTVYTSFLYYEYFLGEQISVSTFWQYLQLIQNYESTHGRPIPYSVGSFGNKRTANGWLNSDLLFMSNFYEFLRYTERTDPWYDNPKILMPGVEVAEDTNIILECLYIARIDAKFAHKNVRIEAILPMDDGFHAVDIMCSDNLFKELLHGSRYKTLAAKVHERILLARERKDNAIGIDMRCLLDRNLEINGCTFELSNYIESNRPNKKRLDTFRLVDVNLRSSTSFLVDEE